MADQLTAIQRAFVPIHQKGDLPAAVRLARGIVIDELLTCSFDDDPNDIARKLAGDLDRARGPIHQVSWDMYSAQMLAALAMGIAIGQLVHPDVFKGK